MTVTTETFLETDSREVFLSERKDSERGSRIIMLVLSKPHISNRSIIGVGKRTLFSSTSFYCRGGLVQKREIRHSSHLETSFLNNLLPVKICFLGHPPSQVGFFSLSPKNLHDKKLILQEELYG